MNRLFVIPGKRRKRTVKNSCGKKNGCAVEYELPAGIDRRMARYSFRYKKSVK